MPKRPREHVVGDEARIEFERLVNNWIFTEPTDYGVDGIVEITEDEQPTGKVFNVQLKGTDDSDVDKALKYSFDIETLNYYHQCETPVLLVRYLSTTKEFYYIWAREIDLYYEIKHKTKLIKFPSENQLNSETLMSIKKDVESYYRLKSKEIVNLSKPIIKMSPRIAAELSKSLLEVNLISEISKFIDINSRGIDKDIFIIELTEKKLVIRCTKFYALHINNFYNKSFNVDRISKYISFFLLFILLKLTKSYNYLLACIGILISNDISIQTSMYWSLINISFEMRHYDQFFVLIENGIKKDLISIFDEVSLLNIYIMICKINDKGIVNEIMELIEETLLSSPIDDEAKARTYYNLGNKFRCIVRDHKKAIHMYNLASKYDKTYKERGYYNTEIGNSLFLLDKFIFSSYFFAKGFFLSPEPINLFYLADSKLYSGKYKEANCYLQDIIKNEKNNEISYFSEVILKEVFTRFLCENFTEEQNRNTRKAYDVLARKVFDFETMIEGLKYDFLNEAIWFNLGIIYSNENKHDYAFLAFVFCTILESNDYESYVNALIAYLNINECEKYHYLLYTLLLNGYLLNENEFELNILTTLSSKYNDNKLVDLFYDILQGIKEKKQEKTFTIRGTNTGEVLIITDNNDMKI